MEKISSPEGSPSSLPDAQSPKIETEVRLSDQGFLEVVDVRTGQVLSVERTGDTTMRSLFMDQRFSALKKHVMEDGSVIYLDPTLDIGDIQRNQPRPYSPAIANLLANMLSEGLTLAAAAKKLQIPTHRIRRWQSLYPEFKELLAEARQFRAEMLHDEALTRAREEKTPANLHIETLKWAAERGDPHKYSPTMQTKVSGQVDHRHSVQIVVETGIRRPGDAGFTAPDIDITPEGNIRPVKTALPPVPGEEGLPGHVNFTHTAVDDAKNQTETVQNVQFSDESPGDPTV